MRFGVALLAVCVGVACGVPVELRDVTVQTTSGPVVGHHSAFSNARKFLGIPFAAPPVGELRWKAPQAAEAWTEARPAHKLPVSCAQSKNVLGWDKATKEDCLYLNVFTPNNPTTHPSATLPVLVWFYGGSWEYGGTSIPIYDGELDATANNVIVVTVNYRLGVFGFLGSKSMQAADSDHSTGNFGIMDQRFALQWVKDNIGNFGGNRDLVTMFGQSAGSGSVAVHLVSGPSQGLFHRAIMQSGPFADWTARPLSVADDMFGQVVNGSSCASAASDNATLACLRNLTTEELMAVHVDSPRLTTWGPVVDGVILTEDAQVLAKEGKAARVPVMIGTTKDEATTLIDLSPSCSVDDYKQWLSKMYGSAMIPAIDALYPVESFGSAWLAGVQLWTDWGMTCPARRSARWLRNRTGAAPVFLYQFTHTPEIVAIAKRELGAFHGAEIAFVFRDLPLDITPGEQRLANVMSAMWTSFAAHGDPNMATGDVLQGVTAWPAYDNNTDASLSFNTGLVQLLSGVRLHLRKAFCDFWDQHSV